MKDTFSDLVVYLALCQLGGDCADGHQQLYWEPPWSAVLAILNQAPPGPTWPSSIFFPALQQTQRKPGRIPERKGRLQPSSLRLPSPTSVYLGLSHWELPEYGASERAALKEKQKIATSLHPQAVGSTLQCAGFRCLRRETVFAQENVGWTI